MANKYQHITPSRFKNRCFIGLNKVTFYTEEGDILHGDKWLELTDEQSRRNMMITFFAPRDLNNEPMDPATILFDDNAEDEAELVDQMKNIAMFDLCQAAHTPPNTVNVLLVADVIFHWDNQDNYIQPTSDETWIEDLKEVLKGYPRTTKKIIYTDWDIPPGTDFDDADIHPSADIPLDNNMWINQPNFQEKYGKHLLIAGVLFAVFAYAGLTLQDAEINDINQQTRSVTAQGSNYRNFDAMKAKVVKIERNNKHNGLFTYSFKDVALALADIEAAPESYALRKPNPNQAGQNAKSDVLISRLQFPKEAYPSFSQQEPLAANLLRGSITMAKIRKPKSRARAETFTLEGLIPLPELVQKQKRARDAQTAPNKENNK